MCYSLPRYIGITHLILQWGVIPYLVIYGRMLAALTLMLMRREGYILWTHIPTKPWQELYELAFPYPCRFSYALLFLVRWYFCNIFQITCLWLEHKLFNIIHTVSWNVVPLNDFIHIIGPSMNHILLQWGNKECIALHGDPTIGNLVWPEKRLLSYL